MGATRTVFLLVGGAIALALAAVGVLYAIDYKVDATVEETDCTAGTVDVQTAWFGLGHTVTGVPLQQCLLLQPGNFVEYNVRSERTRLFDVEGGKCIYDSVTGVC